MAIKAVSQLDSVFQPLSAGDLIFLAQLNPDFDPDVDDPSEQFISVKCSLGDLKEYVNNSDPVNTPLVMTIDVNDIEEAGGIIVRKGYVYVALEGEVTIDYGDGTPPETIIGESGGSGANTSHTYADNGIYTLTVTVTGRSTLFKIVCDQLTSVDDFGSGFDNIQFEAAALVTVPNSVPTELTNFDLMFWSSGSFNQDIAGWDVSNVTSMAGMFADARAFNQDISTWCVSNIPTEPPNFSGGFCPLAEENHPVWGTCPA